MADAAVDTRAAQGPRSSIEKLQDLIASAKSAPADPGTAQLRQTFSAVLPMILRFAPIPDDPAELDQLLLIGASLALRSRSDGASTPSTIAELVAITAEEPASSERNTPAGELGSEVSA